MSIVKIYGNNELSAGIYYEVDTNNPPLGVGGMGQVFKGIRVDSKTGMRREVAIKFLFDDLPAASIERSRREASIQINNENLVEMLGFIELEDSNSKRYHVVSELLHGVMLFDLLKGKTTDNQGDNVRFAQELLDLYNNNRTSFAILITKNILSGIMALHDNGYIHRDIDPSNVMVTSDSKIKLIDFGISKQLSTLNTEDHQLTTAGQFMGKAAYAAPELAIGDLAHQNETTDVYAIGIMLYQLMTGSLPFNGPTHEILQMQINNKMPLQNVKDKNIRQIIKRATSKKQSDRYQSAAEFRVALEQVEKQLKQSQGTSASVGRKNPIPMIKAGVAAIGIIVGLIIAFGSLSNDDNGLDTDTHLIAVRTDSLLNVIIDSKEAIVKRDSLTGVDIKSSGKIIEEAIAMLSDSSKFSHGMAELKRVTSKGYKSSSTAAFTMACVYLHRDLDSIVLRNAEKYIAKDYQLAEEMYRKAYMLDSTDYKSLYGMGCIHLVGQPSFSEVRDLTKAHEYFSIGKGMAEKANDKTYISRCEEWISKCEPMNEH